MPEALEFTTVLAASPRRLYEAWLDSREHGAFTGASAEIVPTIGGRYSAWYDYIRGENLVLEPYSRIVQSWRTTEFPEGSADSQLEVRIDDAEDGARLTLIHTNIPDGQAEQYRRGWHEYYFKPMALYFADDTKSQ